MAQGAMAVTRLGAWSLVDQVTQGATRDAKRAWRLMARKEAGFTTSQPLAATKPERRTASPCRCSVGQPLREAPSSCLLCDLCALCDLCVNTSLCGTITRPAARADALLPKADRACGWLYRVNAEIAEGAEIAEKATRWPFAPSA